MMKIVDLYIGKNFLKFFLVVIIIPVILFSFFQLLSELDSVGKGSYSLQRAILFILLTSPKRFLDLAPITSLLAAIAALGRMADRFELVAMEASGISNSRISLSVLGTCGLIMAAVIVSGEFIVPPMEQSARLMRAQALSAKGLTFTQKGFWARRADSFVHVKKLIGKNAAEDIDIFSFDGKGNLKGFFHAKSASITGRDKWILHNVTEKLIKGMDIQTKRVKRFALGTFLSREQVSVLELPPESLSAKDLNDYIKAFEKSGQNADSYRLALWRKISQPLTTGAMAMLALGFVFGSTRKISSGLRITIGSFIGIALYFFDQITMHVGLLLGLRPSILAFIPFLLISTLAALRLRSSV